MVLIKVAGLFFLLELLANLPMWEGFVIALRLFQARRYVSAAVVQVGSMFVGMVLVSLKEPYLTGQTASLQEVIIGGLIFLVASFVALFVWGFSIRLSNWKLDIALGLGLGILMAAAQAVLLPPPDMTLVRMALHAAAIGLGMIVSLMAFRWAIGLSWSRMLVWVFVITALASALIVVMDYSQWIMGRL